MAAKFRGRAGKKMGGAGLFAHVTSSGRKHHSSHSMHDMDGGGHASRRSRGHKYHGFRGGK